MKKHECLAVNGRTNNLHLNHLLPFATKRLLPAMFLSLTAILSVGVHANEKFTLTSSDVKAGASLTLDQVANSFGCSGKNISPALSWTNAPKDTRSFVLTVYDPDAPTGSGFWHWVVFNIPATATGLPQGIGTNEKAVLPAGAIQSRTDVGVPGFIGACPPVGDKPHRYQFNLYALDTESLPLTADATPAVVGFNVHFHTLAKAQFEAVYQRKQ